MRHTSSVCALSCFLLVTGFPAASHASKYVTLQSHVVKASDGSQLSDVEPGALPGPTLPEGSVLALVSASFERKQPRYIAEIDVARSRTVRRANVACESLLRDKARLYASCGKDVVALDVATLGIVWRSRMAECPGGNDDSPVRLESNGAGRLAVLTVCSTVHVSVVNADTGAVLGGTQTEVQADARWIRNDARAYFHGPTVIVHGFFPIPGDARVAVLSADYTRVARSLHLASLQAFWDDGVHLHALEHPADAGYVSGRWDGISDAEWEKTRVHGPTWLHPGQDVTLSDALLPLSSGPIAPEVESTSYRPSTGGGEYIDYEMDLGPMHFWMTRSCCGGDIPGGLWVGRKKD
jgi:hypothetical protein